jgi:endonuclease/exonuclease/phosphatase family metal-dependent hydrolase
MRIASYNVENLFDRPKVMNLANWEAGRPVLDAFAALSQLIAKPDYSAADQAAMVALLTSLGLAKSNQGPFVELRENRSKLIKRSKTEGLAIIAKGRADWVGSLELVEAPVDEQAMRNTARGIADLKADVLAVVEAESRPALTDFNRIALPAAQDLAGAAGRPFSQVMIIDGNDPRGIDVGVMTAPGFTIDTIRSHVDDRDSKNKPIFSRDCPEYIIRTPGGGSLLLMVNHLKSKGYGDAKASAARRKLQATRIAEIYKARRAAGIDAIIIAGDFNDYPGSAPLKPLLEGTDLKDVSLLPGFDDGGLPGTFETCRTLKDKIDFLLLSPALVPRVRAGGLWRMGMWPGSRPPRWPAYDSIKSEVQAASDHAAIWADLEL